MISVWSSYYGDVVLTEAGRARAQRVRRRHDLLSRYLRDVLGVSDETAETDACRIEHVVSDELIEIIAAYLQQEDNP